MRSLHLDSVVSTDGRGVVALVYSDLWSVLEAHWLEPRLGVFRLQHGGGWKGVFCVSHDQHDPVFRCRQWNDLSRFVSVFSQGCPVFMLADHNSVHLLVIDTSFPLSVSAGCQVARAKESQLLQSLDLTDAWLHVHSGVDSVFADSEPVLGYTFRFGHNNHHLRRLDRVHVPSSLVSWVSECYSFFLGGADHKAVFVDISPPETLPVRPRFRMNVSFLQDDDHEVAIKKPSIGNFIRWSTVVGGGL